VLEWIVGQFEDAIDSFNKALSFMRQHTFIDYRQLGLNYVLFSFEILFNRALCHLALSDSTKAICDLEEAQKNKGIREHEDARYLASVVRDCWEKGNLDEEYLPFSVPEGLLYRPSFFKVKNTERADFLGSSKVIASLDNTDDYNGFSGPSVGYFFSFSLFFFSFYNC
jgi:tetratricopeptide (TPR) repeat protein